MLTCLFQHCKFIIYPEVILLTQLQPMFHFYTPRKHQKTSGFLMFSGGTEVQHWLNMG